MESMLLDDWMTTPDVRLHSHIIADAADQVYHRHTFFEIFYILDGSATHIINETRERITAGDIVFLNLNDSHGFYRNAKENLVHRDIVIAPAEFKVACDFLSPTLFREYTEDAKRIRKTNIAVELIGELENAAKRIINIPAV